MIGMHVKISGFHVVFLSSEFDSRHYNPLAAPAKRDS
jgi:hypothetical protein